MFHCRPNIYIYIYIHHHHHHHGLTSVHTPHAGLRQINVYICIYIYIYTYIYIYIYIYILFHIAHKSGKPEDEEAYRKAKKEARKAVALAKSEDARRFAEMIEKEDKRENVFRAAKRLVRQNGDVTESGCVEDGSGRIVAGGPGMVRA